MDKRYYYIGEGVFHHKGKDYGYGEALPADVPEASIESMLTKKKVSETKPAGTAGAGTTDDTAPYAAALETIKAMEQAAQEGSARISELERLSIEREELISELRAQLVAARATITEKDATIKSLTDQLMGAGKGKQK